MTTVVSVVGTLDRGGVETAALNLCRTIPSAEVRQILLITGAAEGTLAPQFRAAGALVHRCPVRPTVLFPVRLWRYLRHTRPDVVVSHISVVSGLVLAVAGLAGVGVRIARMSSEGDGRPDNPRRRLQRAVLRALLRRCATDVLGVTAGSLAFAGDPVGDTRFRVLPNGIDVARFASVRALRAEQAREAPSFVYIGRAAPEKNRGFLLKVHAEAKRVRAATTLTVVGPGGTSDLAAVDSGSCYTDPSVHLIGESDQVEEVLGDADVLLLPSHREGLPTVVLEALAAGVPVLATYLPGLRDLAREVRGLTLLPLSAGPSAWARTALALADLPSDERDRISDALARSPFTLAGSAAVWKRLWTAPR